MSGDELKIKKPIGKGKTWLVNGELELIKFALLQIKPGEEHQEETGKDELGIVLLSGKVEIEVEEKKYSLGPRRDVFLDFAWGLYVPAGKSWKIIAEQNSELALCYAPGPEQGEVILVSPEELVVHQRGKDHFQRRVVDIMVSQVSCRYLLVGETFNFPGQWSSYPPHRHDRHNPPEEYRLEEIYFYKLNPEQGFGLQRIYNDNRSLDVAYVVENNDLIIFKEGYHPVVSAPGYWLYYLWVLAGPVRIMKTVDDPAHSWVHNLE